MCVWRIADNSASDGVVVSDITAASVVDVAVASCKLVIVAAAVAFAVSVGWDSVSVPVIVQFVS